MCTTEVVPAGFTLGVASDADYDRIVKVKAQAIMVDGEALHRGSRTALDEWTSTLSLEMCTASGWDSWKSFNTGGTTKPVNDDVDWKMLVFSKTTDIHEPDAEALPSAVSVSATPSMQGLEIAELKSQQTRWEFS